MFSHSNWILLFCIIFLSAFAVVSIRADVTDISAQTNTQYTQRLTAAAHSAMEAVEPYGTTTEDVSIWGTQAQRDRSLDAFFKALGNSFMTNQNNAMMRIAVPIILMIDVDGYYVNYNATLDAGSVIDPTTVEMFKSTSQMSPITPWSVAWPESHPTHHIRYYLGDRIQVITNLGKSYTGTYAEVAEAMVKDGAAPTDDIVKYVSENRAQAESDRDKIVMDSVEKTLNYYANQYNYGAGRNGGGYTFVLPRIKGEDWHRMVENPTFIAFMQGHNANNGETVINTYAYTGSELIPTERYYIAENASGRLEYHSLRGALQNGELKYVATAPYKDNPVYVRPQPGDAHIKDAEGHFHDSYIVGKFYNSMAECTRVGANPCPDCVR